MVTKRTRPQDYCIDCGKRHRAAGPRCRACRIHNELALTGGHWAPDTHGIQHWHKAAS